MIYKKIILRTDAAAMNKVLHKELKNSGDHKFARWQALFINFDFSIEHIKGTTNSLADFLSHEHLQVIHQALIVSIQLRNNNEHIENIPDRMPWEEFRQIWVPRWGLRKTEIISPATQMLYSVLVPEVRRQGPPNLLLPVIHQATRQAIEVAQHLTEWFHDIDLIWKIEREDSKHKYFYLNRPRSIIQWPEQNHEIIFPETCYNYYDYTRLWWKVLYQEDMCFILKFGCVNSATRFAPPSWLYSWWKDFGFNKEEADPNVLSLFCPLNYVRDLNFQGPNDQEIYQLYIMNHFQWVVKIQTMLQRQNGILQYVRKIYTKAWDTLYYPEKFSSHIEND